MTYALYSKKRKVDGMTLKKFQTLINRSFRYDHYRAEAISQVDRRFDEMIEAMFDANYSPSDAAGRILNVLENPHREPVSV